MYRIAMVATLFLSPLGSGVMAVGNAELTEEITTLFRIARQIVSANKPLIKDPVKSWLKPDKIMSQLELYYKRSTGKEITKSDATVRLLLSSMRKVFDKANAGGYAKTWPQGSYANKFLPARFAREVSVEFSKASKGKYVLHLTAPDELLVNGSNKADSWETKVIKTKLQSKDWKRGKAYSEQAKIDGKKAWRFILPEYYNPTCMGCHGQGNGAKIHKSGVDGKTGRLGGAISFAIVQ